MKIYLSLLWHFMLLHGMTIIRVFFAKRANINTMKIFSGMSYFYDLKWVKSKKAKTSHEH